MIPRSAISNETEELGGEEYYSRRSLGGMVLAPYVARLPQHLVADSVRADQKKHVS